MVELNRIDYEGLDRRFILAQFTQGLENEGEIEKIIAQNEIPVTTKFYTSEEAREELEKSGNLLMRVIVRTAYKFKKQIKKIPVLGNYAIKIKESYLTREGRIIDVSYLLAFDVNQFIYGCYQEFLNREPDRVGFSLYQRMICEGAPKEAIVYLFAISDEFNDRFQVENLYSYKRQYSSYKRKSTIKKIPIVSNLISVIRLPSRIHSLIIDTKMNNSNRNQREEIQTDMLNQLNAKIEKMTSDIAEQNHQINIRNDVIKSEINSVHEKIDGVLLELLNDVTLTQQSNQSLSKKIDSALLEMLNNITLVQQSNQSLEEQINQSLAAQLNQLKRTSKTVVSGTGITAVQTEEFLLGVPSEEWRLAMYLSVNGVFEYGSEKLFKSTLKQDFTVVDIGANLGIYTLHAVKAGCKVYSYEPTPSSYYLLNENIQLNGFAESKLATTYNLAVGEKEKDATLTIVDGICGWNNLFEEKEEGKKIIVPVVALDHHLPQGIKVDIVKIDVEGGELFVLEGMKRIIKENPQIKIFMEYAPEHLERAKVDPLEFLSIVRNMGFDIKVINEGTGELFLQADGELQKVPSSNLFLTIKK